MDRARALAAALAFSTLAACGTTGGPAGGTGGATGASGAAGTGGGGGGTHDTTDGLGSGGPPGLPTLGPGMIGSWQYATGTTTQTCPGQPPNDAPVSDGLDIAAGATAGELIVTEPGACSLRFTLVDRVATIARGQTCAGSDGAGGMITFSMPSWTLTLSADAQTLSETLDSGETFTPASGAPRTCRYTETGVTLRRR